MGNYATCKKYTQKEKNQFILLTRSHFSLIAKNCVGLETHTLLFKIKNEQNLPLCTEKLTKLYNLLHWKITYWSLWPLLGLNLTGLYGPYLV